MTQPIYEQVRRQLVDIERTFLAPVGIVFSVEGYKQAMYQDAHGMFNMRAERPTYMNMPYRVDHTKDAPLVKVLDEQTAHGAIYVRIPLPVVAMSDKSFGDADIVVLGRALTKAQLCDVISAWCQSHHADKLAGPLAAAVHTWGEFE